MPTDVEAITREHVESFISDVLNRRHADGRPHKATPAHQRCRGCQRFFNWLVDEGEIKASPMARMKPPKLGETPPPVLREAELKKLIGSVARDTGAAGNPQRWQPAGNARPAREARGSPPRRRMFP